MRIGLAVLCLVFAGSANAIYKCKNTDGSISFSDAPCGARDDGVDLDKEKRYQESLEQRKVEEKERKVEARRERDGKLLGVRQRTQIFLQTYFKVVDKNAIPPYTADAYPELEEAYYDRMVDIESMRLRMVRLVLNSQQCDKVMSAELDQTVSTPELLSFTVGCANGKRFAMDEKAIETGNTPVPIADAE